MAPELFIIGLVRRLDVSDFFDPIFPMLAGLVL